MLFWVAILYPIPIGPIIEETVSADVFEIPKVTGDTEGLPR